MSGDESALLVRYGCRNCGMEEKVFALLLTADHRGGGLAMKFGELPPFGPRFSNKLLDAVKRSREFAMRMELR